MPEEKESPKEPPKEEPKAGPGIETQPKAPQPGPEKKEPPAAKKEKPAACEKCGKKLSEKSWYFRNGKYFCNKKCWKAAGDAR